MARVAKHRQALVQTAMRLFRRQGYASSGLNQILDESGAPKGSLYHHFPGGKEALAEAAVDHAGELIAEMLESARERHPADLAAFAGAYAATMAEWMAESGFRSGCPIATTLLETTPENAAIAAAGARALDRWVDIVGSVARQSGMQADAARRWAHMLICAMEGALIVARVRKSKVPILDVGRYFGAQ